MLKVAASPAPSKAHFAEEPDPGVQPPAVPEEPGLMRTLVTPLAYSLWLMQVAPASQLMCTPLYRLQKGAEKGVSTEWHQGKPAACLLTRYSPLVRHKQRLAVP